MDCFRSNKTESFIFLLKYGQRKIDLNTSKKNACFRYSATENFIFTSSYHIRKFHIYAKVRIAERYSFLTFSFEGKLRKHDISEKRKHTKTNENVTFSALLTNFRKTKILFFMLCILF